MAGAMYQVGWLLGEIDDGDINAVETGSRH
jgi:hypothetical protein